jgi:hypothetical protein
VHHGVTQSIIFLTFLSSGCHPLKSQTIPTIVIPGTPIADFVPEIVIPETHTSCINRSNFGYAQKQIAELMKAVRARDRLSRGIWLYPGEIIDGRGNWIAHKVL